MRRIRRLGLVALTVVAAFALAGPSARAGGETGNPYSYVITNFVDYSANSKPYEGYFGTGLQSACPDATAIDAAVAKGTDVGVNATVGDRNGRVVARVRTQDQGVAAKKARAALRTPACLAYASDAVVSGALAQYPTRPAAPTFAPATMDVGGVTRLDFSGSATTGPFVGAVLMANAGSIVNLAAVRVDKAQPGELDTIVNALAPTVRYAAEVASVAPPASKLFTQLATWGSAGDAAYLDALKAGFPDSTAAPAPRAAAPAYPAGCDDAFDAFVYAGQRSALGGTAFVGGGNQARVRVTPQVFATPKEVKAYTKHFDDLSTCMQGVYTASAGGQPLAVTRAPTDGASRKAGECAVMYTVGIGSPVAATTLFGVYAAPKAPRAVTVTGLFGSTPAAQTAATGLCAALDSAYGKA